MTPGKGHDVLLDALATVTDLSWRCACVGSLDRDPAFADALRRRVRDGGLADRVCFPGPRTGADLDRSYAAADLLVLASRAETYGMVVTEALARGLPVVATDVGGVPEALGTAPTGPGRGCWSRRATRRRSPRRCGPGSATPSCAGACAGPPANGARRSPAGRPPTSVRRRRSRGGGAMTSRPSGSAPNGSPCASLPTPRPARDRPGRAPPAAAAGQRPPGDPRPRLRHRRDGPLARAAAARAAALGPARPRRRPARDRSRGPSRPPRRRGLVRRRDAALGHHPATPRTISPARP